MVVPEPLPHVLIEASVSTTDAGDRGSSPALPNYKLHSMMPWATVGITVIIGHMGLGRPLNFSKAPFPCLENREEMHENALQSGLEM